MSIIIITKNRSHLLSLALQSALGQTFQSYEIVIVDVTSSDETEYVVRDFDDKRIVYIRENEDRGISASRNLGIRQSKGEFIAFLDDDDLWLPEKLEKQLSIMNHNPEVGVVYTAAWKINEDGCIISLMNAPFLKGKILPKILEKNYVGGCSTVLVRKECIEKAGLFDEDFFFGEDHDLWVRLAKHCQFDYIKEPVVLYRVHMRSVTKSSDLSRLLAAHELFYNKHVKDLLANKKALAAWCYYSGRLSFDCGNETQGRKELVRAIVYDPSAVHYYARLFSSFFGQRFFALASELIFSRLRAHFKHIQI